MSNRLLMKIKVETGARGPRGLTGLTPQLSVANTITGAPNTNAEVTIAGSAENPALTFTIPIGRPFDIAARYESISDLTTNTNPNPGGYTPELFDLAIIQSNVEDEDNARLYIFDDNPTVGKGGWTFISDLSGATGPRRNIRWKEVNGQTTSILQWELEDGSYDETDARDLALKFEFKIVNDQLLLEIENADGITDTVNLTVSPEFGDGMNATVTSVRFNDNAENTTPFQELGVYSSWDNTKLILTNPDSETVEQELALDFNWDGTTLQIKNPTEESYIPANQQKLSPDIAFDTSDGVSISVVEPGVAPTTEDFFKISPDITFKNEGDGVELSIVEPGAAESFNKISPDIIFDGTKLAIVEPGVTPDPEDFVELKGETGDAAEPGTPLFKIRDEDDDVNDGFEVKVADEIQFLGSSGIEVKRSDETFTIDLIVVDGGEFDES